MDTKKLREIRDRFPTSSWAVWSVTFPEEGCAEEDEETLFELIERNRHRLKSDLVLLMLNPGGSFPAKYRNFHSTDGTHDDSVLRDLIYEYDLTGAFMTDLVADVSDPNSSNVSPEDSDIEHLLEQLRVLGEERYHVLCFHHKVFPAIRDYFDEPATTLPHGIESFTKEWDGRMLRFDRVFYPGGQNRANLPELREQLNYLSSNRIR